MDFERREFSSNDDCHKNKFINPNISCILYTGFIQGVEGAILDDGSSLENGCSELEITYSKNLLNFR